MQIPNGGVNFKYHRRAYVRCHRWADIRCQHWADIKCQRWADIKCQRWADIKCQRWAHIKCRRWANVGPMLGLNVGPTLRLNVGPTLNTDIGRELSSRSGPTVGQVRLPYMGVSDSRGFWVPYGEDWNSSRFRSISLGPKTALLTPLLWPLKGITMVPSNGGYNSMIKRTYPSSIIIVCNAASEMTSW